MNGRGHDEVLEVMTPAAAQRACLPAERRDANDNSASASVI
jgi:hypothetical protein